MNFKEFKLKYKKVYFMGIGGISMSGLAEILYKDGIEVLGSDRTKTSITDHLEKLNIKINFTQEAKNIIKDLDLIVYTAAIKDDNEEFIKAKELNIEMIDRAEMLGILMTDYKNAICIAGTHGKTTTTSIMSDILLDCGINPTITVGGNLASINSNFHLGTKDLILLEACEYSNSFLKFFPTIAVILNIELDHLDFFNSLEEVYKSFNNFAKNINEDGYLIINNNIEDKEKVLHDVKCKVIKYGNKDADYYADNVSYVNNKIKFDVHMNNNTTTVELNCFGEHNVSNSLSTIIVGDILGIEEEKLLLSLKKFRGVKRRMEYKGNVDGIDVYDDYAHHPTEVKTTLEGLKAQVDKKIYCVFQPHTYTRTKTLLDDFATSFLKDMKILVVDIYAAREKLDETIHSKMLVEKLVLNGYDAEYIGFNECTNFLKNNCKTNDLVITMGAGDVFKIGEDLLAKGFNKK